MMGTTHEQQPPLGDRASIFQIGWDEYRAIDRMNPSTLVYGLKSMRHLRAAINGGFREETNAMRLGTGIHALTLEPEEFADRFAVLPDFHLDPENKTAQGKRSESKSTTYYQDQAAMFAVQNRGKSIIESKDYAKALAATQAVAEHPEASVIVKESRKEQTVTGEIEGVKFKGRIDLISDTAITDLKSTQSCDRYEFARVCRRLRYDFKMAIYRELVRQAVGKTLAIQIIAQETDFAFDTVVYPMDVRQIDAAFEEVLEVIAKYKAAVATNVWLGSDGGKSSPVLVLPDFGKSRRDTDDEVYDGWSESVDIAEVTYVE